MPLDPQALKNALQAFESGKENQAKLEQTLGRALLRRLEGKKADLDAIFKEIGGTDPVVSHVLVSMTDKFNELGVSTGTDRLKSVVNDSRTLDVASLRSCSAQVSLRDVVEHTAHTFAKFATSASKKKAFGEG